MENTKIKELVKTIEKCEHYANYGEKYCKCTNTNCYPTVQMGKCPNDLVNSIWEQIEAEKHSQSN